MFEKEIQAFEAWKNKDYDEVKFGDLYARSGQFETAMCFFAGRESMKKEDALVLCG